MSPSPEMRFTRLAPTDTLFGTVQQAYAVFDRPAPKHLPACTCALCGDRARAKALKGRLANGWSDDDVFSWFDRIGSRSTTRDGVQIASRTDHAVFRFLLPRVLELIAAGAFPRGEATLRNFAEFLPGRTLGHGADETTVLDRFGALLLDRALFDPHAPLDVLSTLQLLANGGWSMRRRLHQAYIDPDLPAALARSWGRSERSEPLFAGLWPLGAADAVRETLASGVVAERLMNFAMASGTSPEDMDAAMRAADRILR